MLSKIEISDAFTAHSERLAYGISIDGKVVESKNSGQPFPSASVIKAFLLFYTLKNREDFKDYIETSKLKVTDDSIMNFFVNEKIPLEASLSIMISISDNCIANYIIDTIGMDKLNLFFKLEGFKHTRVERNFLDFDAQKKGMENTICVDDVFLLLEKVFYTNSMKEKEKSLFDSIMKRQFDRSKCNLYLPESIQTGGKSGTLNNVWNDFIYFKHDNKIISVCFLSHDLPIILSRELISSYTYYSIRDILGYMPI
jgi:beta-lactamase class A